MNPQQTFRFAPGAGSLLGTMVLISVLSSAAIGQPLIRPQSATSTSEFSGSYVATNTINGSGLPANFTLADAHATYVAGNHWTTRRDQTIGQSITWSFSTPQTLGAFHFWNHRSDNIANNANYEVTQYDLDFFSGTNGSGSSIASLTGLSALPDLSVAQTRYLSVLTNVSSVRLTVRATQNGNSSEFTGLAEVAFSPCVQPFFDGSTAVAAQASCASLPVTFVAAPLGSTSTSYQWRWRSFGSTPWTNIVPGANVDPASGTTAFTALSVEGPRVTMTNAVGTSASVSGGRREISVIATNPCGSGTSQTTQWFIDAADLGVQGGAIGRDGVLDNNDFAAFVSLFFSGDALADVGRQGGAVGSDGVFDNNDFATFISLFFQSCTP